MKRKIAISLMTIGLILLSSSFVILIYNNIEDSKAKESSNALINNIRYEIEINKINYSHQEADPFDEEMLIKDIDGYGYIGYLSVPSLNLDLPVMSTWDYSRLKISPCRYYGSTKTNNLVIAAHNYKSHFGYLGKLQSDDIIIFTDMEGEVLNYTVTSVELLKPYDVDLVKDTGDDLILYTCTYGGESRIAVRCTALR